MEKVPLTVGGDSLGRRDSCTNNHAEEHVTFKLERRNSQEQSRLGYLPSQGLKLGAESGGMEREGKDARTSPSSTSPGEQSPLFKAG